MSQHESSLRVVENGPHSDDAARPDRKRARPLTAGQEALFFGVTFAIAVVFQLAVLLRIANVITW